MELDQFSLAKRFVHVREARVAYTDEGEGPPVLLLHGCPFSELLTDFLAPAVLQAR